MGILDMIRTGTVLAGCVLAFLACAPASAQKIYKCKNEKGEIFYSQAYDPKQCGGGGAQLNADGIAVKEIERRKTPEELAAEKEAAARLAADERIAAERKRQDDILMQSYPSEADLRVGHEQELRAIDGSIKTQQMSASSYEKTLDQLLAQAADSERAGNAVPKALADRIDKVRGELDGQRKAIERTQEERAAAVAAFDSKLARWRELKARQDKQLSGQ
jgi:chromosome segregation ATPase